jgi:hypothetical protein
MRLMRIALIISLTINAYFGIMWFISSQFSESSIKTWNAMTASPFSCPEGKEVHTEGSSKLGRSRSCRPLVDGKWEAWESSYKAIDGEYRKGEKDGKWTWYHPNGSIYRIILYKNNVEVSNNIINEK